MILGVLEGLINRSLFRFSIFTPSSVQCSVESVDGGGGEGGVEGGGMGGGEGGKEVKEGVEERMDERAGVNGPRRALLSVRCSRGSLYSITADQYKTRVFAKISLFTNKLTLIWYC